MAETDDKVVKIPRKFYPENLDLSTWLNVERCYADLIDMSIESVRDLLYFLERTSELEFIIGDLMARKYIKMTCNADNSDLQKDFNSFYSNVVAPSEELSHKINEKFYKSPFKKELPLKEFAHLNMMIANTLELFRENNIPLKTKEMELQNKYGEINSQMTAIYDGKEQTLAQLSKYLENPDRNIREVVWHIRYNRLLEDREKLNLLFDELKEIRIQQACNSGYDNYRDYKHQEMGRFAYSPSDTLTFHKSVEDVVLPFIVELNDKKRIKLGFEQLKPWDSAVDADGRVLKPFTDNHSFIVKTKSILSLTDPVFGYNFARMHNTALLDLDNRKGKSPGGYNYPLREMGSSFIFMNAVGLQKDIVTLLHEAGHAMHSFATSDIKLAQYRECPSEVAELASMAMELLTMDFWDQFYPDAEDLRKARLDQLKGTLSFIPWCMIVDAFQHWVYTNPQHSISEREEYFASLMKRFNGGLDWTGLDEQERNSWMFQLHIFDAPFYYIEYGIAQLGALAIYKNYREDKKQAIRQYQEMLSLGYTKPIDQLYEVAGIKFDFSAPYISELVSFVRNEMNRY